MTNDSKFNDARASLKDLAKKVETIDLSGSGLVGGAKRSKKRTLRKKSVSSKKSKTRSTSAKKRRTSKSRSTSARKRSSSKKKSTTGSKKTKSVMSVNEHKLADNLIQLGVQLKNMQLDGSGKKRKRSRKPSAHRKTPKPMHM